MSSTNSVNRRDFVKSAIAGTVASTILPSSQLFSQLKDNRPLTNISDAFRTPRGEFSMPGLYPGRVAMVQNSKSIKDGKIDFLQIVAMLDQAMQILTKKAGRKDAWLQFFSPTDRIGIKVNPVGSTLLSTNHEIVRAIIAQLLNIGVPIGNIMIWDRREFQLHEAEFDSAHFPGVKLRGTEQKDKNGSFKNSEGKLYSEDMIDKEHYYWADVEGEYDEETMPYMVNGGKYSYFSKIVTQELDKIINVPILKNAGSSVTLCLKNLAYGSISNTARLHKNLWAETCAEVPCFAPLRDKVVLNIVDGIKGCYDGGPGAKPEFFTEYQTILAGTDPVAVDRIGYNIVLDKRIEMGVQNEENPKAQNFIKLAQNYGLGFGDMEKIEYLKLIM
jgi:hypothetical protein